MSKYRTGHDAPEPRKPKQSKPGVLADNKVGVYDRKGRLRGQVGRLATQVTASRFLNGRPASLQKVNGRGAWQETLASVSAAGTAQPGSTADTIAGYSSRGATNKIIGTGGSDV